MKVFDPDGKPAAAHKGVSLERSQKHDRKMQLKDAQKRRIKTMKRAKCVCGCGKKAEWPRELQDTPVFATRLCGYLYAVEQLTGKRLRRDA